MSVLDHHPPFGHDMNDIQLTVQYDKIGMVTELDLAFLSQFEVAGRVDRNKSKRITQIQNTCFYGVLAFGARNQKLFKQPQILLLFF